MVLFDPRMGSKCADMITKFIKTKLFEGTCRGWHDCNDGDLHTHSQGEGLSETDRQRPIPVMRTDRAHPRQGLEAEERERLLGHLALEIPIHPSLSGGLNRRLATMCDARPTCSIKDIRYVNLDDQLYSNSRYRDYHRNPRGSSRNARHHLEYLLFE